MPTRMRFAHKSAPCQFDLWPPARVFHTSTVVSDAILLFGGVNDQGDVLNDLWSFDLPTRRWSLLKPLGTDSISASLGRTRHSAVRRASTLAHTALFAVCARFCVCARAFAHARTNV
eukprot:6184758-Pleurochrysis_carterae.AAC.1